MSLERCLFVGGPKDGQWLDVPESSEVFAVSKMAALGAPAVLQHVYRAVHYVEACAPKRIFVDKDIRDAHLFAILVKGYRR